MRSKTSVLLPLLISVLLLPSAAARSTLLSGTCLDTSCGTCAPGAGTTATNRMAMPDPGGTALPSRGLVGSSTCMYDAPVACMMSPGSVVPSAEPIALQYDEILIPAARSQWTPAFERPPPLSAGAPDSTVAPNNAAELRPYGGPGGGHHLPAKSAFSGAAGYDINQALAIPNEELARLGVRHGLVTGAQMTGYKAFAETGATLTWEAAAQIETQALVRGGMQPTMAQATVQQAIQALKNAGVSAPTRIPWKGQ